LAIPKTAALMKQSGISLADIEFVTYRNAITAFAQSGQIDENDFTAVKTIDQSQKFESNSILRGGQQPRIDKNSIIIS
ncbi:MAG: hydrolase TatD, partial [Chitinophagaceae bacterium]